MTQALDSCPPASSAYSVHRLTSKHGIPFASALEAVARDGVQNSLFTIGPQLDYAAAAVFHQPQRLFEKAVVPPCPAMSVHPPPILSPTSFHLGHEHQLLDRGPRRHSRLLLEPPTNSLLPGFAPVIFQPIHPTSPADTIPACPSPAVPPRAESTAGKEAAAATVTNPQKTPLEIVSCKPTYSVDEEASIDSLIPVTLQHPMPPDQS